MKIIKSSYELITPINKIDILKHLELIGRVCYKSEDKITEDSASKFIKMLIKNGHEAIIEHFEITVKFICDRAISQEIIRHRIASYAQESTRFCNYNKDKFGNELTFIKPCFWDYPDKKYMIWKAQMADIELTYFGLLENGATPQEARSVLPNSLKTELMCTMNLREWRHFFKLRCHKAAHPQMRELSIPLLNELKNLLPEIFEDIKFAE